MKIETEGDIGDAVILMSIIRQIPNGPHIYCVQHSGCTKFRSQADADRLLSIIKPLADIQPYISECRRTAQDEQMDWYNGHFRGPGGILGHSLWTAHVSHLIEISGIGRGFTPDEPWLLNVEPSDKSKDRIVVARSGRYRNYYFPWKRIFEKYGERLMFVGVKHEWEDIRGEYGNVEFCETKNMLEVAQIIAGSLLFIGNQSSPNAVCEGLKHRSIQEVSLQVPDCIYKRDNAQYCYDGSCILPGFDGDEDEKLPSNTIPLEAMSTMTAPPGMWQYPGIGRTPDFDHAIKMMSQLTELRGKTRDELKVEMMRATIMRCPNFQQNESEFHRVWYSLENAGYSVGVQTGLPK